MNKWEFQELLSQETIHNLFNAFREKERKYNKNISEDELNETLNVHLDNSWFELIRYLVDEK